MVMYTDYVISLNYILRVLGLRELNEVIVNTQLSPFLTAIMKFLAKGLVPLERNGILDKIDFIKDQYLRGEDFTSLAEEIGCENSELLVFAWSNTLTALYMKLINQYSALLCEKVKPSCPYAGETWKDYEEYVSSVWPEDDETEITK